MQETTAPAAAEVVGPVGVHVDEILLAHHGFDHKAHIFGNGITQGFTYQLTGILKRELDLQIFVPVGIDLEFTLPNPLGIILNDASGLKIMLNVEFVQPDPD